ncbi:MAG: Abi family protein [Hydrotalea sp.]|nr:Abi family protein [Hydrotalea sp.]
MSLQDYGKPYLSVEEQLNLIKLRGMVIADEQEAKQRLKSIGYYRLSGYWNVFRCADSEKFETNINFSDVVSLYEFDKKLRLIVLDAIERIEIALRVDIAIVLGEERPFSYLEDNIFSSSDKQKEWLEYFSKRHKNPRQEWLKQATATYNKLPIWMAIELWDFGLLSHFFSNLKPKYKDIIVKEYNTTAKTFQNWLANINDIRNICAHHDRLWNIAQNIRPRIPQNLRLLSHLRKDHDACNKIYATLTIMQYLLRKINPTTEWPKRLKEQIDKFPKNHIINIKQAGFADNWHKEDIWRD